MHRLALSRPLLGRLCTSNAPQLSRATHPLLSTRSAGDSPAAAWEASYVRHFGGSDSVALNSWMSRYYQHSQGPLPAQSDTGSCASASASAPATATTESGAVSASDPVYHGERIVGALYASLQGGMLAGPGSLAAAVFWSGVLRPVAAQDCVLLFQVRVVVQLGIPY